MTVRLLKAWLARTLAVTVLTGSAALAVSVLAALLAVGSDAVGASVLTAFGRVLWAAVVVGLVILVLLLTALQLRSDNGPTSTSDV